MLRLYRDSSFLEKKNKNKSKVAIDNNSPFRLTRNTTDQNHNNVRQYNRCNKY